MSRLHLGSPLLLGKFQLKNRLCFAGHVTNLSDGPRLSDRHFAYLKERISGGIGLLVSDPLPIHQSSRTLRTKLSLSADTRNSFEALVQACHERDVPFVMQLSHAGAHGRAKTAFAPAWSPSGAPSLRDQDGSHEMLAGEIDILIESFITHSREAKNAGFDGIEIIAGGNMLMEQFWSACSNQRQDDWGGSFEGRMAFSGEVVKRIRAELGTDFLIGLVMTTNSGFGNTLKNEDLKEVLLWHDSLGCIDYFSFCLDTVNFPGLEQGINDLKEFRDLLENASLRVDGNVRTAETAEKIIESGAGDWVGMTRALIADPFFIKKHQVGEQRSIRPCVHCNMCLGRRARDYTVACLVNPSAGREQQFPATLPKTETALSVMVAGGGLAGMEAARSAAQAGHRVTLVEREKHLGGQWRLASRVPGHEPYGELLKWYQHQLKALDVELRMGKEISCNNLEKTEFDHLIVATGAGPTQTGFQRLLPNRSKLPGVEKDDVFPVEAVLEGITPLTEKHNAHVLLLDDIGFAQGIGTAIFLAQKGHIVTLLTRHPLPAPDLQTLGSYDQLLAQLNALGVKVLTESVLLSWSHGVAEHTEGIDATAVKSRFDFLVLATTNDANQELENELARHHFSYSLAGDCQGARKAHMAVYEGRKTIMEIPLMAS